VIEESGLLLWPDEGDGAWRGGEQEEGDENPHGAVGWQDSYSSPLSLLTSPQHLQAASGGQPGTPSRRASADLPVTARAATARRSIKLVQPTWWSDQN
jgi:hypothetical protein